MVGSSAAAVPSLLGAPPSGPGPSPADTEAEPEVEAAWLCGARAWLVEQGWDPQQYAVVRGDVQTAPVGLVTVECAYIGSDAGAEVRMWRLPSTPTVSTWTSARPRTLRPSECTHLRCCGRACRQESICRSRVLEVDRGSGDVANVLAYRDSPTVRRVASRDGEEPPVPTSPLDPPPPPPPSTPDEVEEWAAYLAGKEELAEAIKREGSAFFHAAPPIGSSGDGGGVVTGGGLLNQGATCYMNSLLQTLFMTPAFRAYVFRWRPPAGGLRQPAEQCIPLQLQKLFARLAIGRGGVASTKALTTSFGWTAADAFQQHECARIGAAHPSSRPSPV
jgi:hypothetical protein